MRGPTLALWLVGLMLLLFWVAVAAESWFAFALGCAAYAASLIAPEPHHARRLLARLLPSRRLLVSALLVLALLLLNFISVTFGLSAPGRGRGLSIEGTLVASLVVGLVVLLVLDIVWLTAWHALGPQPPRRQRRAYWMALGAFVLVPALFLVAQAGGGESEGVATSTGSPTLDEPSSAPLRVTLGLMAAAFAVAAALPHMRLARGVAAPPAASAGSTPQKPI